MASHLPQSAYRSYTPSSTHEDGKYTGSEMDYAYGDAKEKMQSLGDDMKILARKLPSHAFSLARDLLQNKSKPSQTEELVDIAGMLPFNSPLRNWAQAKTVSTLFNSLQHPPASYLGEKHQYRTADGSNHNFMFPNFGKAGEPYAKSVRSAKKLHGVKPDPGVLFDLLEARSEDTFRENEAGISSIFLYHATIIIHDLFNTDRTDHNISTTSSYLDLAPLYGSNQAQQDSIRVGKDGLLKPDTFYEDRLLGQPPGVNVLLVLYSRFHNYAATMLKEINEDGRFTLRPNTRAEDAQKPPRIPEKALDNDLFQTARLITGGLYISICLGDYLRAIQGVHEKDTTWTFDPRMYIDKARITFLGEGVPRGMGNQVSAEFNLLYRFHSAISKRDESWTENFMKQQAQTRLDRFKNTGLEQIHLDELNTYELWTMLGSFAREKRAIEPCNRSFGDIERGPDGRFSDEDLSNLLRESIDDKAGAFTARNVPKALKAIEIAGIEIARKWEVASLNEFRTFFGLEPHTTFESVNPDPEIQMALENLYDSPDMIEMYPGVFIEEIAAQKFPDGRHKPAAGVSFPKTAGRGVLSDAVTLVRSDRFYTLDYTTATLTNWGLCEAAADYKTLGGSMFHKLIQRGLPGYFAFNSVYALQPMYTKNDNKRILTKLKTIDQFSLDPPAAPKPKVIVETHSAIQDMLAEKNVFQSPWAASVGSLVSAKALEGLHAFETKREGYHVQQAVESKQIYLNYLTDKATSFVKRDSFFLAKSYYQIDMVRDVAIPLNARFLAELFSLNVKTSSDKSAAHTSAELYKLLIEVRNWVDYPNSDPTALWYRRRKAQESAVELTRTTKASIAQVAPTYWSLASVFNWSTTVTDENQKPGVLRDLGLKITKSLQKDGHDQEIVAQMTWMLAVSGVGRPVTAATEVLHYFLSHEGERHWPEIQKLATDNSEKANAKLEKYFMEALRLTSKQVCKRTVKEGVTSLRHGKQAVEPRQDVMLLISDANHDRSVFHNPSTFNHNRAASSYLHYDFGPAGQLGKDMLLAYGVALLRVAGQMDGLRKAPGQMGELKRVELNTEEEKKRTGVHGRHYMTADWGYLVAEPTTWKLHFDTFGGEALPQGTKRSA